MRIQGDLDLPGLERVLAPQLGKVELRAISIQGESLRIEARLPIPIVGAIVLLARARARDGELVLDRFDLEGTSLAKGLALARIRDEIARLDLRWNGLHVHGEPEGDQLHLRW